MSVIKDANLVARFRFLLELGALAALASWGWHAGGGRAAKLGLAVGARLAAAVVWGVFVAPGRSVDSPAPARLALELAVSGAAAAGLAAAGRPRLAAARRLVPTHSLW